MTDTTKTEALRLAERLEQRRQIRWVHSTGESPRSDGLQVDALCMEAAAELRRLSAERDRLAAECEALRAFVARVAKQKPEKPDYWSSCGQCANNIGDAEDLIDAAMGGKE